jgi:general secretion pathway protein G
VSISTNPALFENAEKGLSGLRSLFSPCLRPRLNRLRKNPVLLKGTASAVPQVFCFHRALAPEVRFWFRKTLFRQSVLCRKRFTSDAALAAEVRSSRQHQPHSKATHSESGLTLVELIICVGIVAILATAAIPVARFQVKRTKERELRRDLWEMRDAIDHYKDAADKGAFQVKADSLNYPPDLETLVNGVDIQDKKVKFLRRIPVDPMTGTTDWGLRSNQDDADSDSFGGQNVFDVHTKSQGTALDGTKYSTW